MLCFEFALCMKGLCIICLLTVCMIFAFLLCVISCILVHLLYCMTFWLVLALHSDNVLQNAVVRHCYQASCVVISFSCTSSTL